LGQALASPLNSLPQSVHVAGRVTPHCGQEMALSLIFLPQSLQLINATMGFLYDSSNK